MKRTNLLFLLFFLIAAPFFAAAQETIVLRDNLKKAVVGDFIVVAQDKSYALLHINSRLQNKIVVEEIAITAERFAKLKMGWKRWVESGAPGSSNWVMYIIDLNSGNISDYYSVMRKNWCAVSQSDIFLSKLLTLRFLPVDTAERKRVGPPPPSDTPFDRRPLWQPKMIFEGEEIAGVKFDLWRTVWPKDNSQLSGKQIEVFIPQENGRFPSYFPYWLQISGFIGKAKLRIIDGGRNLSSLPPPYQIQAKLKEVDNRSFS